MTGDRVAHVLVEEVRDAFYGNLDGEAILGVYLDGTDAECEMQRLMDARRGHRRVTRHVAGYRIEEVPLHG